MCFVFSRRDLVLLECWKQNIQWEECVFLWACVSERKRMMMYVYGCAYTENLPTLILLCKLIQGNKKSEESQSVRWNTECRITRWMSHNLFCTALEEKKKISLCFPAEEEDDDWPVYSVHCLRMWTHRTFLWIFFFRNSFLRWMCASSVAIRTSISSRRVQIYTQSMVPHSFWISYLLLIFLCVNINI